MCHVTNVLVAENRKREEARPELKVLRSRWLSDDPQLTVMDHGQLMALQQ
jgi:hypothetical protein